MAKYLLDANHESPLVTLKHPLRNRVLDEYAAGHEFWIAVPALTEMWYGLLMTQRVLQNLEEWELLERKIECLALDEADAKSAASLQKVLRNSGRDLKTPDALIAAVALRYDFVLLTTDHDFTPIPGIKIENWMPPK